MRPSVMSLCSLAAAGALLVALAAGCSSGSSTLPRPGATATSTPSPAPLLASATASITVGTSAASASLGPVLGERSAAQCRRYLRRRALHHGQRAADTDARSDCVARTDTDSYTNAVGI